jgi:hypothetical protein
MRDGELVKQGDVYFALKERSDNKTTAEIDAYLRQLVDFAALYSRLLRPEEEENPAIRERLLRLNRIDMTVAYPFLLNVYSGYVDGSIALDEFLEVLGSLENFMIRRFVCGVPTYGLNKIFPPLFASARRKASLVEGVRTQLASKNYPADSEFLAWFQTQRVYAPGERQVRTKLILELLERSFGHREQVPFGNLTVEHVMPQTLTTWWQDHLGPDWNATHGVLLDTIGNLTLTAYNADMSNSEFPKKRLFLQDSHLELNKYFADLEEWNEAAIRARALVLAQRAMAVWPALAPGEGPALRPSDVTGRTPVAVVVVGERQLAGTWRDVAQRTLEAIALLDPDAFDRISSEIPHFVNADPNSLRSSRPLANGAHMEVGLSAAALYNYCLQATSVAGLSGADWMVEFA